MSVEHPPPRHDDEPATAQEPEPPPAPPAINPYARPVQAEAERPVRPGAPQPAGPARRLAGGLLIVNSILVLVWVALTPAQSAPASGNDPFQMGGGVGSVVPALIDVAIGVSLLRGSASLVPWAILRCIGGLVLSTAIYATKDPIVVAHQVLLSGSLVGLLAGQAGQARTAIAGSVAGLALVFELLGIAATATGQNPLGSVFLSLSGDIEPSPVEHATGRAAAYELTFPNREWHPRTQAAAARDNPIADRWFVRPDKDAHVLVIAEHVPGKVIPIDAYTDAILSLLRKDAADATVHSRGPWPAFGERGRLVDAASTGKNGLKLEWRYALVTVYERAYYIVGFASRDNMPSVEAEIRSILGSFKLPEAVQGAVSPELLPEKVTSVRGSRLPYTLSPPADGWYLRKPEVFKAENPLIDQWLTRPETDAHVFVVAEQADPGNVVVLNLYADNVIQQLQTGTTRGQVLERRPWDRFPSEGARFRLSVDRDGKSFEYDGAVFARGPLAFQIVGLVPTGTYPAVEQTITQVIESFQPPP